jgi:SAM-dependent methyltransferase
MISPDEIYHDDWLVSAYDSDNVWDQADEFYQALAAEAGPTLLDLGCGTGRFGARLASLGHRVVGVDPAEAMLRLARGRPHGDKVTWVLGDARSARLEQCFDLVMMTGHAFQVLLSSADQLAVLRTMAAHLATGGRFAFETRNPLVREWRSWIPAKSFRRIATPAHGAVEMWDDVAQDPEDEALIHLSTYFRFVERDEERVGRSILRFTGRDELAPLLDQAGLTVERWLGDWDGSPFDESGSKEIIVVGRLREGG